jgi:sulfite exporter TauE/SafE
LIALLASVLGSSLLGSLHCAGMCGGFVCAVSTPGRALATQAAWHAGRGAAYLALGIAAGSLGLGLERTLAATGLSHAAAIAAGVLLVAWGAVALARSLGVLPSRAAAASPVARVIASGLRGARAWPPIARSLAVGGLTAFLPCGWLWAFVATAGGTGEPARGALVMLAFWAGTLPALLGLGLAAGRALEPLRRRLPALTAAAMIVVGLATIAGRFRAHPAGHGGAHPQGAAPHAAAAPHVHEGPAHDHR